MEDCSYKNQKEMEKEISEKLFNFRFEIETVCGKIKNYIIKTCFKRNFSTLVFDEKMYKTNGLVWVIPSTYPIGVYKVIGFELKTDRGTKELQLLYIQDNQLKRCFTFETLNEQSIWWDLSRVIDYYNDNVWKQE